MDHTNTKWLAAEGGDKMGLPGCDRPNFCYQRVSTLVYHQWFNWLCFRRMAARAVTRRLQRLTRITSGGAPSGRWPASTWGRARGRVPPRCCRCARRSRRASSYIPESESSSDRHHTMKRSRLLMISKNKLICCWYGHKIRKKYVFFIIFTE